MGEVVDYRQISTDLDRRDEEAEAKAKMLRPFNPEGQPYNRERVVQEAQFFLYHHAKAGYELGKRLVLLKENESAQLVAQIIEEKLHLPLRTAQFYEMLARICAQSDKFRAVFGQPGQASKGLALLAGLSDPEVAAALDEFEATGQLLGMDEATLIAKSRKELIAENRRLRKEKLAAGERLERENAKLKGRIEALEATYEDPGLEKSVKLLITGEEQLTKGLATVAGADFILLSRDAGSVQRTRLLIDKVRRIADWLEAEMFGEKAGGRG